MYKKKIDLISLKVCREKSIKYSNRKITNAEQAYGIVKEFIGNTDREYFVVMNLNTKNEPCSIEICSIGLLNKTLVHPREIFKSAIITNADKIIIFHTHPSNSVEPSYEDIETTNILIKVSSIIKIPIIDHIIVGESEFFSFAENGYLNSVKTF